MFKTKFDFKKQLYIGELGENDFISCYKNFGPIKSKDRKFDFILNNGDSVELKTDTYDMNKTENFFMELYSDIDSNKIGGPWRARMDVITFFVYYFSINKTFFWFNPIALCMKIEEIIINNKLKPRIINNKGWKTQGYVIPRVSLLDIVIKKDYLWMESYSDTTKI